MSRIFVALRSPALYLLIAALGFTIWFTFREIKAADFYATTLRDGDISERVSVGGTTYPIVDGRIQGETNMGPFLRFRVLRVAAALAFARRSPTLGIAGVDPDALEQATELLASSTNALAAAQQNVSDAERIRSSLYPIDFLRALAALTRDRQAFISSGSEQDDTIYERALETAVRAGIADAARFEDALSTTIGTSSVRFPTLGGTLTSDSLTRSADIVATRFAVLGTRIDAHERCLDGELSSCGMGRLAFQLPPAASSTAPLPPPPHLEQFLPGSYQTVALETSSCLAVEPSPYLFAYGDLKGTRLPVEYASQLYFTPVSGTNGTTTQYLRNTLGIEYSLLNPLEFYVCPDVLRDIGSVEAVLATVRFAKQYPAYAKTERSALLRGPVYREASAISYVRSAATDITAAHLAEESPDVSAFEDLLGLWNERSAGLDLEVGVIAAVDARDAMLHASSTPIDVDARTMFLTHSAFPSLFLAENRSVSTFGIPLRDTNPSDLVQLRTHLISYSALLHKLTWSQLQHDLNAFLTFEGISQIR